MRRLTPFECYLAFVLADLLIIAAALYAAMLASRGVARITRWAGVE